VSGLSSEDIDAFVQIFEASDWDQVDVVVGDVELHLSKTATAGARIVGRSRAAPAALPGPGSTAVSASATADTALIVEHAALAEIASPHIGTFFRAAKPGAAPFVEVGQSISADTEVCLLEVMNLFTNLRAGIDGVVRQVCATDGALVEGGEVLFLVEPKH
jgi:acetyl-CoA carboxylase biotin carboxyl carrier protein